MIIFEHYQSVRFRDVPKQLLIFFYISAEVFRGNLSKKVSKYR